MLNNLQIESEYQFMQILLYVQQNIQKCLWTDYDVDLLLNDLLLTTAKVY